ncbi:hypothetical protein ACQP1G_20710 [Nocardia sp. CA-107356]|uniref:hypothetical protein n=1 Tax=Nocardia sp. CA-107356 TaxID=3239972 RepID=UPI003D94C339
MAFVSRRAELLSDLLITLTAGILPRSQRDRYRDEWQSALDDMRAQQMPTTGFALTMLLHAPSFHRAATTIQHRRGIRAGILIRAAVVAVTAIGATAAVLAGIVAIAVGAVAIDDAIYAARSEGAGIGATIVTFVAVVAVTAGLVVTAVTVTIAVVRDDSDIDFFVVIDFAREIWRRRGRSADRRDTPQFPSLGERPMAPVISGCASTGAVQELRAIYDTTLSEYSYPEII